MNKVHKIKVIDEEIQDLTNGTECGLKYLLQSKGMPMTGTFNIQFDTDNFIYHKARQFDCATEWMWKAK